MLKIRILGDKSEIESGLNLVSSILDIEVSSEGIPVMIEKNIACQNQTYGYDGEKGTITYTSTNSFFRLLNLWIMEYKKSKPFEKEEKVQFEKTGVMIDASRNAVMNVSTMKEFLLHMAKMGLNLAMLYTEDTYEVKEYPYFGYLRGRYTQKELKELDDYAFALGIEMVPCIQTLGHLYLALKYEYANAIRDTSDVVLVGEPKTYEFLENLIRTASAPFRSNRIHIGMDEAFGLGSGAYKARHGIRDNFSIMNDHLKEVVAITEKHGLEPMMWSDMYYRFGSKTGDYYDLNSEIPNEVIDEIPQVDMVLWDYYHEDQNTYDILLEKHIAMKQKVIFAGGIWTWNGIAPNYGKTFETTKSGLASCKRNGIKEVFATMWGDDGGETPILSALPGMQLYAEMSYHDHYDEARLEEEFLHNTGYTMTEFYTLNALDETPGVMKNNLNTSATSKVLLWNDPLLGLFDKDTEGLGLSAHYKTVAEKLAPLATDVSREFTDIFAFYHRLAIVMSTKADFGVLVKQAYDADDKMALEKELDKAKELKKSINDLRLTHQRIWMRYNKPFGWEVLDIRYGGIFMRFATTIDRLSAYLDGTLEEIPELMEEKLPFSSPYDLGEGTLGRGLYKDMVTAGKLSGV
ncbi:beta-N-acetylhexosaminidase [Jeotgalibaca sp. A127]|uniref:beta-N-acetylhexosaminidase n=1 Tax=Jeotgalibaca sp. A127 TaxID=3457324 RepID=UPI003FD040EC